MLMAKGRQAASVAPTAAHAVFDELYAQSKAPLYNYIYRLMGGNHEQADDLLQETFVKVYRALDRLPDGAGRTPWLYRIATNACYDVLRRRRLISWLPWGGEDGVPEPAGDNGEFGERYALSEGVREALRLLPASLRAPLLLHAVQGFSYSDIAGVLDITEAAVKMRVSRARAAFRQAYHREDEETEP